VNRCIGNGQGTYAGSMPETPCEHGLQPCQGANTVGEAAARVTARLRNNTIGVCSR
jgi:hypothetical protein